MVNSFLILAGLAVCASAGVATSGPTIKAKIQSNWPQSDQITQFL